MSSLKVLDLQLSVTPKYLSLDDIIIIFSLQITASFGRSSPKQAEPLSTLKSCHLNCQLHKDSIMERQLSTRKAALPYRMWKMTSRVALTMKEDCFDSTLRKDSGT